MNIERVMYNFITPFVTFESNVFRIKITAFILQKIIN